MTEVAKAKAAATTPETQRAKIVAEMKNKCSFGIVYKVAFS